MIFEFLHIEIVENIELENKNIGNLAIMGSH